MRKIVWVLGVATFLILTSGIMSFSQEVLSEPPETQWLWGEVVSIDTQKNELLVKYLDYETEQEKEIVIAINEQTAYENVNTLSEINLQDAVSIDYVVSPEGKNIAKNVSVEKPEALPVPQEETAPEDLQPISPIEE